MGAIWGKLPALIREDNKVSHYIINRIQVGGVTRFKIGDKEFNDIPSLLSFYKSHYLDTTTLIRPAPREKLMGKYDFPGRDPEDLPFRKGDILEVISKDEEEWWTARDRQGRVGQIPVKYTSKVTNVENGASGVLPPGMPEPPAYRQPEIIGIGPSHSVKDRALPAFARVVADRTPNAYDKSQLKLKKGEVVKVLATNVSGQWEGEVNGRRVEEELLYC
nr:hypothetical protein BaRGS_023650 [Batillaria attramentaria]